MYLIGRIKTPFISFMRSRRTILSHCWLTWTFWNPFSHSSIFSKRQSFTCFYLIILFIDYRLLHICLTVIHCNKKSTDILFGLIFCGPVIGIPSFLQIDCSINVCQEQNKGSIILTISCRFEFEDGKLFESLHLRKKGSYHAWRVIWIHCRIAKKLVFNKRWIMAWHISYFNILMQIISKWVFNRAIIFN